MRERKLENESARTQYLYKYMQITILVRRKDNVCKEKDPQKLAQAYVQPINSRIICFSHTCLPVIKKIPCFSGKATTKHVHQQFCSTKAQYNCHQLNQIIRFREEKCYHINQNRKYKATVLSSSVAVVTLS